MESAAIIWRSYLRSFDRFCEETGLWPDSLKIYFDGHELELVHGAQRALRGAQQILIETDIDDEQLEELPDSLGFLSSLQSHGLSPNLERPFTILFITIPNRKFSENPRPQSPDAFYNSSFADFTVFSELHNKYRWQNRPKENYADKLAMWRIDWPTSNAFKPALLRE